MVLTLGESSVIEKPRIFISHISDEAVLADVFKNRLQRDFPGLLDVFVSSDEVSIEAGANWLEAVESALKTAKIELILCSKTSVKRPWINFEAGAGWLRGVPIVPVCHTGLRPSDLPMPLTVLQAIEANKQPGIDRLYRLIARTIGCDKPSVDFDGIIKEVEAFEEIYLKQMKPVTDIEDQRMAVAKTRIYKALRDERYTFRSLKRLAIMGGVSVSEALDILQGDPDISFDLSESLGRIVHLASK
jgi:hypothetical protein